MDDPSIVSLLTVYDVFAILDPCTSEYHSAVLYVDGFSMFYSPRCNIPFLSTRPQGGIIVYVRKCLVSCLKVANLNAKSNLDMISLTIGDLALVFAYIVPPQSSILNCLLMSPWESLRGEVACFRATHRKVVVMGNFNSHTGVLSPSPRVVCSSEDPRVDTYGRHLLSICRDHGLVIVNGSAFEPMGRPTFFLNGSLSNTVIDYVLASFETFSDSLVAMSILPPILNLDHAPVCLVIDVVLPAVSLSLSNLKHSQIINPVRNVRTVADSLLERLVVSCHKELSGTAVRALKASDSATTGWLRRELNHIGRIPGFYNDPALVGTYKAKQREFTCLRNKREEGRRKSLRAQLLQIQGRKEYWDFVRSIRGSDGVVETDGPSTERHFRALLGNFAEAPQADYSYRVGEVVGCLDLPIEPWEVRRALVKMKNSACGEDRISAGELRKLEVDDIARFFAELDSIDDLPESWTRLVLVPIPKPGKDRADPANLRGLLVQTAIRRLYSRCLLPRLMQWIDDVGALPEFQTGFWKGYRTTDNLAIMRALQERCVADHKDLFVAFIDVEKAFDNVSRALLWSMLHRKGAKGQLIVQLRKLYHDTSTVLRLCGRYSESFKVTKGVLQGDPLLPILFVFYIAELDTSHVDDATLDSGNLRVSETLIADDTAFPSTSALGLQFKLNSCFEFYRSIGLKINAGKSKVLRLVSFTRRPHVFYIEDSPLEEVQSFKYIGYMLESGTGRGLK